MSSKVTELGSPPTNGAAETINASQPYVVDVEITGSADLLFHRWNCEAVEAKSKAAKGSKAKKSDDIESYVYRDDKGELCMPGKYLWRAIVEAAKYRQDPRFPRKSAADMFRAGMVPLTALASLGKKDWDYEDRQRVTVQRNAITRCRPAIKAGWKCTIRLLVLLPEYISSQLLQEVIVDAGRLVGVGDFRPTYGRFNITSFDVGFEQ